MEKMVRRHSRPVECRGEQDIEIEQGKWRDQEIRLVDITEFHRFYALFSQDRDSGQYHAKQQNDRQYSEIFWHQSSRIARVRPLPQLIPGTPFKTIGVANRVRTQGSALGRAAVTGGELCADVAREFERDIGGAYPRQMQIDVKHREWWQAGAFVSLIQGRSLIFRLPE